MGWGGQTLKKYIYTFFFPFVLDIFICSVLLVYHKQALPQTLKIICLLFQLRIQQFLTKTHEIFFYSKPLCVHVITTNVWVTFYHSDSGTAVPREHQETSVNSV